MVNSLHTPKTERKWFSASCDELEAILTPFQCQSVTETGTGEALSWVQLPAYFRVNLAPLENPPHRRATRDVEICTYKLTSRNYSRTDVECKHVDLSSHLVVSTLKYIAVIS